MGEGQFSFRADDTATLEIVDSFAERAGKWIATYRDLNIQAGAVPTLFSSKLQLREDSSFEQAQYSAEALWKKWRLGEVPAEKLRDAITRELGVLILFVDAPPAISGAASQLPGLQTILVNRREPPGRRNYDLAHELFHVLTWDAMPPQRIESQVIKTAKGNRIEQLANNFAAALLMPEPVVSARWQRRGEVDVANWVSLTSHALKVSAMALQWRLVNLKIIAKSVVDALVVEMADALAELPLLFSADFVQRVHDAVEAGRLSLRRAAKLLDLSVIEFLDLCRSYELTISYDAPAQA